jgi:hypothetical protein
MSTVEIRVRPVVRHVVTRYSEGGPLRDGTKAACSEKVGEFDNEQQAERVAEALRDAIPKPKQYIAVERTFDSMTNAAYFDMEADALAYVAHALTQDREYRVFSRELTDPVAIARHEAGRIDYGFPGGIEQVELPPKPQNTLASRYAIGERVVCVGYEHIVRHIKFTPGKIVYGLAFHSNPDGDVIEYPSEDVYPLGALGRK